MPAAERVFWRNATCTVWVGYDDAGALVLSGDESAYLGEPGASYEYRVTVPAHQFDKLRQVLGGDRAEDVLDLVCEHVEEIMSRGERSWFDDHGIERGFSCY